MSHQDDLNDGAPAAVVKKVTTLDTMRAAIDAEKSELAAEWRKLAREQVKAEDKAKPSWLSEWWKPAPILAILAFVWGGYQFYQHDSDAIRSRFEEQGRALIALANRIDNNDAADRATRDKNLPIVERNSEAVAAQKLINDQQNIRIEAIAQSVLQMRASIETLRDTVQKTHEEMMVDRAKREGRLTSPHGIHAPTPDESTAMAR